MVLSSFRKEPVGQLEVSFFSCGLVKLDQCQFQLLVSCYPISFSRTECCIKMICPALANIE